MVLTINSEGCFGICQYFTNPVSANLVQLGELLIQHPDPHCLTVFDSSLRWLHITGHQSQQCRLAGTVSSKNSGTLPRPKTPCNISQDLTLAEAHADVFNINNVFAQARYGKTFEFYRIPYGGNIRNQLVRGV